VQQAVVGFVKESWQELKKVTWPSRKEIWTSSLVVIFVAVLFMLLISGADWCIHLLLKQFY
jgi:preprotein translocase subunit SecE